MKVHEFTLILDSEPDEAQADEMYRVFDDGTLSTVAGVPQVHFHREAPSLVAAMQSAIADVRRSSFEVVRVEMAPDAVQQAS